MGRRKATRRSESYDIGFGKPPEYTRYRSGESGNPKGRPKKVRPPGPDPMGIYSEADEALRAALDRVITINEGGNPKKVKARDLVPCAQINAALKGNSNAQRHLMLEMRDLERRDAERARRLAEEAEIKRLQEIQTYEYIAKLKEKRAAIWAEAAARGCEPDQPWSHPDDILLYPDTHRWHIRGPIKESCLPLFNWYRAERDYLYAYAVLRSLDRKSSAAGWHKLFTILWASYDVKLPLRWQLIPKLEIEFFNLAILTVKKLEALVEQRREEAALLKIRAGIPDGHDKESYKITNTMLKPLLNLYGYRSLAELERANEPQNEKLPMPKVKA